MSKEWTHFPIRATRYSEPAKKDPVTGVIISDACALHFGKQPKVGWRFVVHCDGDFAQVGGIYRTKELLMEDLPEYAKSWGLSEAQDTQH